MKKLNYLILGLAGLAMASCSNEDLQGPADGTYQITVSLPKDMGTRAIGDTPSGQILYYTLFQVNENETTTVVEDQNGVTGVALNTANQATLDLPLVKGYTYKIAFFACTKAASDVYSYSEGNLTVTYAKMTYGDGVSADAYDCFAGSLDLGEVQGSISKSITLNRPVAQINWGTTDLSSAAVTSVFGTALETSLSMEAFTTLNVLTGTLGGTTEVTFPATAVPSTEESFPVNGYSYLAMQYVLAQGNGQSGNYDLTLTASKNGETSVIPVKVQVDNAPLQANYRTNIYGALLTDQATLNVSLATWGEPSNDISLVWDGETKTTPTINTKEMTVAVNAASDLAGLADIISGETTIDDVPSDLAGYTVTLSADYDLDGHSLSLGSATRSSGSTTDGTKAFRGTFNGNGKTISGLNITYDGDNGDAVAAFIPNLDGDGEVKNVTFDNVTINGGAAEQASIVGLITNGAKVSGVTVSGGSISATEGAAGIVGRILSEGSVENCINYADITVSKKNGGGIVGAAYYGNKGMTISNCKNYGKVVATAKVESIGGIVATCSADVIGCTNYGPVGDSTIAAPAGGIVGYQISSGSIENCTNEGTIMGAAEVAGIVAFVGNVTYAGYTDDIYLTGNTNKGTLNGSGTVGGILGINRNGCKLENNTNSAPSMTGNTVAGIVGNAMTNQGTTSAGGYVWLVFNSEDVNSNVNNTPLVNMHGNKVQEIFTGTLYVGDELQTIN